MRLQPTLDFAESPSATYLCTVFGLFHNAGHQLLAGHELEFARAVGIKDAYTANAIEAGIDLLVYAGYTAYVNSWHILALGRRLRCAAWKPGLAVIQDRFAGIRSTFCDKYGQ
jgi:hypothetical protein